jgi:Ni/Co efflux regulator RcnB
MSARNPTTLRWAAAGMALAMGLSAVAVQAQPRDPRNDHRQEQRRDQRMDQRHDQRNDPRYRPGPQQVQPRPPGPQYHAQGPGRGAGPDHRWYRGDRVPPAYRGRTYVVNDWRGHRLSAPPRGYHWVQYGSDYLLVAIATGVIAQLILGQ